MSASIGPQLGCSITGSTRTWRKRIQRIPSPAHADLRDLPPLLIQVDTAELLYDQVNALARRAKEAGVEVTFDEYLDRVHLWHSLTPMFPEFQASIDQIGKYALERTSAR